MINIETFSLTEIPEEQVAIRNGITQVKVPVSIVTPPGSFSLNNLSIQSSLPAECLSLSIQLGNHSLPVWLTSSKLNHWLHQTLAVTLPHKVPEPLRLALLEKSILSLQSSIHQTIGHKVHFNSNTDTVAHSKGDYYLSCQIVFASEANHFTALDLYFSSKNTDLLLELLKRLPRVPAPSLDKLPVAISLSGGYTDLDSADYRRLASGDIILFDNNLIAQNKLALSINNTLIASGSLLDGRITIESVEGTPMDHYLDNNQNIQPETNQPLDTLPIRLNFELGSTNRTLAEVKNITAGHVIELNNPLDAPVLITVNGQCIGRGELVKIGDHCGVRVLSFTGDHDAGEP